MKTKEELKEYSRNYHKTHPRIKKAYPTPEMIAARNKKRKEEKLLMEKDRKIIENARKMISEEDVMEFLKESNLIEGVRDQDSLEKARRAWDHLINSDNFTEKTLLTTHKILMQNQCLMPNERGYYRRVPVYIGGREGMEFSQISDAIKHWLSNVNDLIKNGEKESKIFLEGVIKTQHVEYEKIHPFVDGNGRTGRMFLNYTRFKLGLPILIIHSGEEQMDYYKWFK